MWRCLVDFLVIVVVSRINITSAKFCVYERSAALRVLRCVVLSFSSWFSSSIHPRLPCSVGASGGRGEEDTIKYEFAPSNPKFDAADPKHGRETKDKHVGGNALIRVLVEFG